MIAYKCLRLVPFWVSAAFLFAACDDDDDDDAAPADASTDVILDCALPSGEDASTSTEDASSQTEDAATGPRAATLNELEKNMELKLFDQTVYLSTGSKHGLFALRIPGELWLITYADFANGEVTFDATNTGKQSDETDAAKAITDHLAEGIRLSFRVDLDGTLLYAVNGSEYSEAVKASAAVQRDTVSKAEEIKDKIYTCTDGEAKQIFTFFDSAYIVETLAGEEVTFWQAGRYDIQRATLLMRPFYSGKPSDSIYLYRVGTDHSIAPQNGTASTVEATGYAYEQASDFVGDWVSSRGGIDWKFSLKADGTFGLTASEGGQKIEDKSGVWEIYGYQMMMQNQSCLHSGCTSGIHGQLQTGTVDRETGRISGFSFIHSDPDTPAIPTSFDAQ